MPEVSPGVHVQRIYVDTSVFGGYFDPEFEIPTRRLFEMFIRGEARLVLSDLTMRELGRAPRRVRLLLLDVPPQHLEDIGTLREAEALAELYLREGGHQAEHACRRASYRDRCRCPRRRTG